MESNLQKLYKNEKKLKQIYKRIREKSKKEWMYVDT